MPVPSLFSQDSTPTEKGWINGMAKVIVAVIVLILTFLAGMVADRMLVKTEQLTKED